ncbi:MAG: hypothetical protein Q4C10_01265 [Clostridia bacterium]|nr:hypothetical protein [Clostridia bacterium]
MKKTVLVVMAVLLVMSMLVYAVADVLSVDEAKEVLNGYIDYLVGDWRDDGGNTISIKAEKLSISADGRIYLDYTFTRAKASIDGGEILLSADEDIIYILSNSVAGMDIVIPLKRVK